MKHLPFPNAYMCPKKLLKDKQEQDIMNLLGKLEVNMPLDDLITSISKYVKFMKELCTNKKICKPN